MKGLAVDFQASQLVGSMLLVGVLEGSSFCSIMFQRSKVEMKAD